MRRLDLRGQTWWFQMAIPAACRPHFNGTAMRRLSLETGDIKTAQARRDEVEQETLKLFGDIRAGKVINPKRLYAQDRGELWRETIRQLEVSPGEDGGEPDDLDLASIARELAEDEGDKLAGRERQEFVNAYAGRVKVDQHLEAYLKSIKLADKTTDERRGLVMRFVRWCDKEGLRLPDINRKMAGRYVTDEIEPMHFRTAKKHMTALRGYWEYLRRRGHVDFTEARDNPWNDQIEANRGRKGTAGQDERERPFTTDEVKALLSAGPDSPGSYDDQIVQVLTIGLLTGMREAEIVTLKVADLFDGGDGHGTIFDVKDSKTKAGLRQVPMHPDLTSIVAALTTDKKPTDWLFSEYAGMPNPGDTFGKRFKRYREIRKVDDKREGRRRSLVNFHSARKWFVTEAHRAGFSEDIVAAIVGHEREGGKKITFGVYSGGPSGAQKRACVEAVKLPDHSTEQQL